MEKAAKELFGGAAANGLPTTLSRAGRPRLPAERQDVRIDITKAIHGIEDGLAVGEGDLNVGVTRPGRLRMVEEIGEGLAKPDQVEIVGAACEEIRAGEEDLDITFPCSVFTPIIKRNTTIPTRDSQVFSTASDSQTSVEIHVLQGERTMAADNKSLGKFTLDGIPPAPRGIPQIEVIFDINANGILEVTAKDKATNRQQNITITASSGLSDEEVEKMRRDAEAHAEEDQKHRDLIEARNTADNAVYSAEKTLKDLGEKVPADIKSKVEDAVAKVRSVKDQDDTAAINASVEELMKVLQEVGQAAYSQTPEQPQETESGAEEETTTAEDPDIVDGEFTQAE